MKIRLFYLLVVFTALSACKTDDEVKLPEVNDLNIFDVSSYTDWDYWVVGKLGDYFFTEMDGSSVKTIFFKPEVDQDGYPIFLDENSLPTKVVIDQYIFLIGNHRNTKFDVSIISPDGTHEIIKDIETGVNWDNALMKSLSLKSTNIEFGWRDGLRWSGHVAGGVVCGLSVAATEARGGAGLPLTIIGCGSTVVGVTTEFLPDDYEIIGVSATTIGSVSNVVGCDQSAGVSCMLGAASSATSIVEYGIGFYGNSIMDGRWTRSDGMIVDIDCPNGSIVEYGSTWIAAAYEDLVSIGDLKFRNIIQQSDSVWNCEQLWFQYFDGTPYAVMYSNTIIRIDKSGTSFIATGFDPWDGDVFGSRLYTRFNSSKSAEIVDSTKEAKLLSGKHD